MVEGSAVIDRRYSGEPEFVSIGVHLGRLNE
jgi:hypothetical protein